MGMGMDRRSVIRIATRYAREVRDHWASSIQAWPIWPFHVRVALLRFWGVECAWHAQVEPSCYFTNPNLTLGDCFLNHGVHFDLSGSATITVGDNCDIGMGTMLVTSGHETGGHSRRAGSLSPGSIVIEPGSWLGARVLVLSGVTIGAGCVIAAGAVVTNDCAPDGLYAGIPARRIRDLDS
jgi:maltose O-acetyltransferase